MPMPTTHTVDCLFNLAADRAEPGAKSAGFGLSGAVGGYADGAIGPLHGVRKVEAGCIEHVT